MREEIYTPVEAAKLMGYTFAWVYRLLAIGRLPSVPVPGSDRLWVARSAIVAYMAEHVAPPYPPALRREINKLRKKK
jgi:predicted DNA-binding transcriptional regulator AlpA